LSASTARPARTDSKYAATVSRGDGKCRQRGLRMLAGSNENPPNRTGPGQGGASPFISTAAAAARHFRSASAKRPSPASDSMRNASPKPTSDRRRPGSVQKKRLPVNSRPKREKKTAGSVHSTGFTVLASTAFPPRRTAAGFADAIG